jgi:hypothetical protein
MPLKETVLEQQLERAKSALALAEKSLDGKPGKKQALWRRANARVNQIEERLQARARLKGGAEETSAVAEEKE